MEEISVNNYVLKNSQYTVKLLKKLASIPAPLMHEEKRADFILSWLHENGAEEAYTDSIGNVIYAIEKQKDRSYHIFSAHMDVVFPDNDTLPVYESDDKIWAPGIGDDTASLVNLMMTVKYFTEYPEKLPDKNYLFVFNVGEEGYGNLRGTKKLFEDYAGRISTFVSFDTNYTYMCCKAVGSLRYRITATTIGGHSYANFGRKNAIEVLADLIEKLYTIKVPDKNTTYNVGMINGGTSVNTIAQNAEMMFEFRSDDSDSLEKLDKKLKEFVATSQTDESTISIDILGKRPCGSKKADTVTENFIMAYKKLAEEITCNEVVLHPASTDANIPLSLCIPAVTFGTSNGNGAHTREEWIYKDSLIPGQKLAIRSVQLDTEL
jgi:acetylornithine deacetylase/succinyl-diaminopimelate desuccinylase-like protein